MSTMNHLAPSLSPNSSTSLTKSPAQYSVHFGTRGNADASIPQVVTPSSSRTRNASHSSNAREGNDVNWGSNFWVTLVDPQTQSSFFACPATGEVSWDPPVGHFVLPPSNDGEWWELGDDSRGGLPYYYHTKTGETVWERPSGFVIPLGIIQNTALGRRLSQRAANNGSKVFEPITKDGESAMQGDPKPGHRKELLAPHQVSPNAKPSPRFQRSSSASEARYQSHNTMRRTHDDTPPLATIPGSENSAPPSGAEEKSIAGNVDQRRTQNNDTKERRNKGVNLMQLNGRVRAQSSPYVAPEIKRDASLSISRDGSSALRGDTNSRIGLKSPASSSVMTTESSDQPGSAASASSRSFPVSLGRESGPPTSAPTVAGKKISAPIPNHAARMQMSPVKNRATGAPIPVEPRIRPSTQTTATLSSGTYPVLPHDLAMDIQQFSQSDFARQYFATHRIGFIFRRRVPVTQLMTWQKAPLSSPLLTLNRSLAKDAVKVFKIIQHVMGDRELERSSGPSSVSNASMLSLNGSTSAVLEVERWLLGEGLTHGELRDEIYSQVMKQLTGNPNPESIFKGWQLLCVMLITFPPSKNFEGYLSSFIQKYTTQQEGRVDVMAKYCLRRLAIISKKGPRGKPPSNAEIETASDAAFNPSTFGESLDAIIRLQERNYPQQKVPIILPFLADGILALGGPKAEGIFRVPGDGDTVSDLKLRIDRGYYTLDGINDPHVLASLMKLWLRELSDPLVPEEMYNECITNAKDAEICVQIVQRLPTINRRVILFVISFLQLFLDEKAQDVTKMTPANLALVMAPNLLRCNSDLMSVVFTNAQYEQIFVYNLLLYLKCDEVDPDYTPVHGLGSVPIVPAARISKSRSRRPYH